MMHSPRRTQNSLKKICFFSTNTTKHVWLYGCYFWKDAEVDDNEVGVWLDSLKEIMWVLPNYYYYYFFIFLEASKQRASKKRVDALKGVLTTMNIWKQKMCETENF